MIHVGRWIEVNDLMQRDYQYKIGALPGDEFDPRFNPSFTSREMLELGVFEGKYLNDCKNEFPEDWLKMQKSVKLQTQL